MNLRKITLAVATAIILTMGSVMTVWALYVMAMGKEWIIDDGFWVLAVFLLTFWGWIAYEAERK